MGTVYSYDYQPPAFRDIKKADLIGMVVVSSISTLIITYIIISFLYQSHKKPFLKSMKYLALGHFIGDWIFCFFAAFIRSDLILPIKYNRAPPNDSLPNIFVCKLAVYPQFIFYYISKASLYLLFIQRIKSTFRGSEHECNKFLIGAFQIIVVMSECILCLIFVLFETFQYCSTKDDTLHICSAYTEDVPQNIGGFAVELIAVFDLIFSVLTLSIFVYKLRKLAKTNLKGNINDQKMDRYVQLVDIPDPQSVVKTVPQTPSFSRIFTSKYSTNPRRSPNSKSVTLSFYNPSKTVTKSQKIGIDTQSVDRVTNLVGITLKCCVLASVAIIANWVFLFIADIWLFDLSWFICIDCLLNGICIYFMFKFAEKKYNFFCKPVIEIWKVLGVCCGITRFNLTKMVERFESIDDGAIDLEIVPPDDDFTLN